jgi:hypothetical protein
MTQIAELTGRARETIRKRLRGLKPVAKDGKTLWYAPREALPLLFGASGLDLSAERARLAKEQADGIAMRNAATRAELVLPNAKDQTIIALDAVISAQFRPLGSRVAPALAAEPTVAGCRQIIDDAVAATLHELADAAERAAGAGA